MSRNFQGRPVIGLLAVCICPVFQPGSYLAPSTSCTVIYQGSNKSLPFKIFYKRVALHTKLVLLHVAALIVNLTDNLYDSMEKSFCSAHTGSPKNAVETVYVQNITDKAQEQDNISNFLVIFLQRRHLETLLILMIIFSSSMFTLGAGSRSNAARGRSNLPGRGSHSGTQLLLALTSPRGVVRPGDPWNISLKSSLLQFWVIFFKSTCSCA